MFFITFFWSHNLRGLIKNGIPYSKWIAKFNNSFFVSWKITHKMKYFKSGIHGQWCAGQCFAASWECGDLRGALTDFCGVNIQYDWPQGTNMMSTDCHYSWKCHNRLTDSSRAISQGNKHKRISRDLDERRSTLTWGLPRWQNGKEPTCQGRSHRRGLSTRVGKILWRWKWQPTTVFLPGESDGQQSLVGYSLQG